MRGIYAITNTLTGTVYYGQSKNLSHRLNKHKSDLIGNKHHNIYLQRSWNKYGENAFVFTPIQIIEDIGIDLTRIEQHYFDGAYSIGLNTFNIKIPDNPRAWSGESRKKISNTHKGKKWRLGKTYSLTEEQKKNRATYKKVSESRKGKLFSEERKKNMSLSHKGKRLSNTTKEKLSLQLKGNLRNLGHKDAEEVKKRKSVAIKLWWNNRKNKHVTE